MVLIIESLGETALKSKTLSLGEVMNPVPVEPPARSPER